MIYFDNNATTQCLPEVITTVSNYLGTEYANPSSLHFFGKKIAQDLQLVRSNIARTINCLPNEIIFTSSGSESNNLCIKGFAYANRDKGNHIIVSKIEHACILQSCERLERDGFQITYLDVDTDGFIDIEKLKQSINKETILVSIMHANNEVGTIQDIITIGKICHDYNICFHTDAVQSYLKTNLDVQKSNISLASFSGHKFHAPKGIGFIYRKNSIKLNPIIDGGGQEFGLRSGTQNIAYIMALEQAILSWKDENTQYMQTLQDAFITKINQEISSEFRFNGTLSRDKRLCNNISISFKDEDGERILNLLSKDGICVSTSSACSSNHKTPFSHVLAAIECPIEYIYGTIRLSFSKLNNLGEIDYCVKSLKNILDK